MIYPKFKNVIYESGRFQQPNHGAVRIIPLGGTGNVTKNMYVYEYRYQGAIKDILIVDCGIGFPDAEMYGVDLVLPDASYLLDKKKFIRGIVFTHGHDDHIGGISYIIKKLGRVPMFGTTLTAAFANIKLKEHKLPDRVKALNFSDILNLGNFNVSFIRLTHSIPDTSNLLITTPIGCFYHGSDFKFDFSPLDGKLAELSKITQAGEKGILCLLTDCLGSERRGFTPSEQVIGQTIEKELSQCRGRFLFSTQSSNISRIQLAIEKAVKYQRKVIFLGRSIDQNIEEAKKLGYMHFPSDQILTDRDLKKLPPNKTCLIIAGSQGQSDSALMRVASDEHRFARVDEGDTVMISAEPIPGNESNVYTLIELLYKKGARVSYSDIMEDLHVSGHGSQGDLMLLLSVLGPKYIFPIGGTYRHIMQYQRLASDLGYHKNQIFAPQDGEILEFRPGSQPRVVDNITLENIMIDGLGIGDVGKTVLRDRKTIASEGIMVIVVPIEQSSGRVISQPDIISRGFVYMKESQGLLKETRDLVLKSLKLKKGKILNWHFIRKLVEERVGEYLHKKTGRSPLIVPVIVEV